MRKGLIHGVLTVLAAAALAACSPGGGTAGPTPTGTASNGTTSASPQPSTPATATIPPDVETTEPAPSPPLESPLGTGPGQGNAELAIVVTPSESERPMNYTLVCQDGVPAAESKHPTAEAACTALKNHPALLNPPARGTDRACTQQFGGPQRATVTGILDGTPVERSFARTDGCEIAAWNAAGDVLGPTGGAL
jgi:hypothetical protein